MPSSPTPLHQATLAEQGVLRPTHLRVSLSTLRQNFEAIRAFMGDVKVMPVLKANAYGHGLVPVAQLYDGLGVSYLGVAYLEEGMRLRREGVSAPILVLGGILGSQIPLFIEHDLTLTASSVDKLRAIDACAASMGRVARVHLKIDTGMERIGVHWYSAPKLLEASLACDHVVVEGIYSHFANADAADLTHARLQMERFHEVLDFYSARSLPTPVRHMANSAAMAGLSSSHFDMVRPGLLCFGVYPSEHVPRTIEVRPAMSWVSRVVYFKVVRPGSPVSYGSTWAPDQLTRMVTVPVGYGDGYLRSMSGQAEVILNGERYPVRGRICMDQVVVDIGWSSAYNGDEVILLGAGQGQRLSVEELAQWAGTIPYEVLTSINTRVPRVYEDEQI
ncbi:MAG: alanine racemase [Kiritimatiellia bacterium]|jgi:alanine racemase